MRIVLKLAFPMLAALLVQPAAYAQGKSPKEIDIPEARWMQPKAKAPAKAKPPATAKAAAKGKKAGKMRPFTPNMAATAGTGPLVLTSSAAVTYQEYFAHACPLVLAAGAAGWNTYAAFGPTKNCPKGAVSPETVLGALAACSSYAANPPCSAVAIGRRVVWNGPISFVPGRYTPQGDSQYSIVLRKVLRDDELPTDFGTTVGLVSYAADGKSGDILFQQDDELGLCRGTLTRSDDAPAAIALSCTKVGALTGTLDLKPGEHTGHGTATGDAGRQFALTVLPHAGYMKGGPAQPGPAAELTQPKSSGPTT